MKKILGLCVLISMQISANDSTGFVATGGVQYLKNPKISMQSEDLFISKNIIRVNYQFKKSDSSRYYGNCFISLAACGQFA